MCLVEGAKDLTAVGAAAASADRIETEGPERVLIEPPDPPWAFCSLREAVSLPFRGST